MEIGFREYIASGVPKKAKGYSCLDRGGAILRLGFG